GAFLDANHFAHFPLDLGAGLLDALLHLVDDLHDLVFRDGHGAVLGATDKAGDLGGVLDQVPAVVAHDHLDQHIAREETALGDGLLAVLDFHDLFGRHQDAAELGLHAGTVNALAEIALDG